MNYQLVLLFVILGLLPDAAAKQIPARPLRAIVSETNTAPYAIFNSKGVLEAGISKDIIDELGRQLQRPVTYLNLPRARVEQWLINGEAEIACFLNPDWVRAPDKLAWSAPLFTTQQLLIRRRDSAPLLALNDLLNKRIGTTRGFTYPELEQVFSSGKVIRDDAHSLESNLVRLSQQRLDVVMSVDLSYLYYVKDLAEHEFEADPLWAAPASVYCALSRFDAEQAAQINTVLTQLSNNNYIRRKLDIYMGRVTE